MIFFGLVQCYGIIDRMFRLNKKHTLSSVRQVDTFLRAEFITDRQTAALITLSLFTHFARILVGFPR